MTLKALPPEEAIAYFRAKGHHLQPSFAWQDLWEEDHTTAHTVAKSAGFDILKDIHAATLDALKNGRTPEQFAADLTPILQAKGWWGRQDVVDPLTGDLVNAQLGSTRRLRTIYDTNMRTAHAAGRWAQIARVAHERPYLRYVAVLDSKTRPEHRHWHGTILPWDHPWWRTHFPPNGWFCRCSVQQLSEADLKRYGWTVNDGPPPELEGARTYVNPRTGIVSVVPPGIDPGFAYNPGQAAVDIHAARVAASGWVDAPAALTAAEHAASIDFLQPLLTRDFDAWVTEIGDQMAAGTGYRATGNQRVVGALTREVLDYLAGLAEPVDPVSGAITVDDRTVMHFLRDAKAARGSALPLDDLTRLPDILAQPERILFDTADPALLYVFAPDAGGLGKVVVRVNFNAKVNRQTTVSNAVRTGGLVQPENLRDPRYDVIWEPQPPGGTPLSP
ncbi:Mu-like prophage FluMu F protein [Nitrospirillum viridazoti Y2]|uniref:SPP1 gp7 family putative phage head morphogenesis protein n=1 Tax=Nitrospirillum amazonense TaxID=28077 RepID=A0A560IPV9_9PROT|nr:phage minor head protein [Nitrospirillum amazonense]EGX99537.1 Mu-like prophage FluMu F protein [Nitrospirillum amazonense Y2]TWB58690.1 SPP1 gp7 family putative phage head morphogenesis protein [Nitrospirillum amazonense]